jgi:hypothetical protein
MKVDLTIAENKAKKKEEKVEALERALIASREKNQSMQVIIQKLREEFIKVS